MNIPSCTALWHNAFGKTLRVEYYRTLLLCMNLMIISPTSELPKMTGSEGLKCL